MELPKHYFPVRVCPHIGEGPLYRLMFAECGSYENVNLSVNDEEEHITFWPQKGQRGVKNLTNNIPSLPLLKAPLNDEWREWDHILNMKNYKEMENDLKYFVWMIQSKRGLLKNSRMGGLTKRFHDCSKRIVELYHSGSNKFTQPSSKQCSDLLQMLDRGMHILYTKYDKIADVLAYRRSCLKGYNREFYGGLLTVMNFNNSNSTDVLVHAGGSSFQDIYMTESSSKLDSRLRHGKFLDKISLDESVFQIVSSELCMDEGLICARQKHKCLLMGSSPELKLEQKGHIEFPQEVLTSVNFSPYVSNEILISTNTGGVYLWDIGSSSKNRLLEKSQHFNCEDKWSCSYFGGHPRQVVIADNTSVTMFDHRSHYKDCTKLFSLSPSLTKKEECVMAATSLGFPYHAVVTDYAVFIIDQRFGLAPVLQWSTEFISCPQYVQVLHQQNNHAGQQEKLLFVASQQPPEVMCFPVTISNEQSPSSPVIPWKISQIGDFHQSMHTSYTCDLSKVEKRFETSLAGIAVSKESTTDGFTVYQLDGYGDVFYQSLVSEEDLYSLQSCTNEDRQAADKQAEKWLKVFDSSTITKESDIQCLSVNIAPSIMKDIFSQSSLDFKKELGSSSSASGVPKLHKNLKTLEKLPSHGSSSKLHLALRDRTDVLELVQKREDDHTKMKKEMRESHLKELKPKKSEKNIKSSTRRKSTVNKQYIESGSCDGGSDSRSSKYDQDVSERISEVADLKTSSDSGVNLSETENQHIIKCSTSKSADTEGGCSQSWRVPQHAKALKQRKMDKILNNDNIDVTKNMSIESLENCIQQQQDDMVAIKLMKSSNSDRQLRSFTKSKIRSDEPVSISNLEGHHVINQKKVRMSFGKRTFVNSASENLNSSIESQLDKLDGEFAKETLSPTTCSTTESPVLSAISESRDNISSQHIEPFFESAADRNFSSLSSCSASSLSNNNEIALQQTSCDHSARSDETECVVSAYGRKIQRKIAIKGTIAYSTSPKSQELKTQKRNRSSSSSVTKKQKITPLKYKLSSK